MLSYWFQTLSFLLILYDIKILTIEKIDINSTRFVSRSNTEKLINSGPAEPPKL